jgi:hypothetical protein
VVEATGVVIGMVFSCPFAPPILCPFQDQSERQRGQQWQKRDAEAIGPTYRPYQSIG